MLFRTIPVSLALSALFAFACDLPEDFEGDDDDLAFRDCGSPCINSPYLGTWDITNQAAMKNLDANSPAGNSRVRWVAGTKNGKAIHLVNIDPHGLGTITFTDSTTSSLTGAIFDVEVRSPTTLLLETGKIWFQATTTEQGSADPTFNITRYTILGNKDPGTGHHHPYAGWWSLCPIDDEGSSKAVLLSHTRASASGLVGWVTNSTWQYAIACDGHSLSKGVTKVNVVPGAGSTRSYGYPQYSSLMQGWQAIFQSAPRTILGAEVGLKDLAHNPPLFNLDPISLPPPVVGQYEWILESVYKDTGDSSRGARCKHTLHPLRPLGEHRNDFYDPPVSELPGWSNLPECGSNLAVHGDVAFYTVEHMIYNGGGDPNM